MRIIELFGGIGACTQALKRLGIEVEVVDYVEIDKYAVKSYNAINETNFETQDITKYNKHFDNIDLIIHGSPCQDFSVAGKQAGGDEGSGTRSSLMYETLRIVKDIKPKYVIWENVKNLLSKNHKHNFDNYINMMNEIGYNSYYKILNAKNYGIPQNRERVFTISIRKDIKQDFKFPDPIELKLKLRDMLEELVDEKYFWNKHNIQELKTKSKSEISYKWNIKVKEVIDKLEANRTYSINAYNRSISDISHTITTPHNNLFILDNNIIRKLTPKECWKLMGFSDETFEKAEKVNSNTQLYKQAGNSIVVDVLEKILKNLLGDEK